MAVDQCEWPVTLPATTRCPERWVVVLTDGHTERQTCVLHRRRALARGWREADWGTT